MSEFAETTGLLQAGGAQRRYLWTDAFAVCNFVGFYRKTNDETFKKPALLLVDRVHRILGRHRADDGRKGWISGLDEREGELHPTVGGLRIGKEINERGRNDPINERLEWDRDGQYFHYLTKWMQALSRVGAITGDPNYIRWATELAKTAYAKFTYSPCPGQRMMHWKMSIDLSYPLVASMGHHDPLDGLITCCELRANPAAKSGGASDLIEEIEGFAAMCRGKDWTTDDPLGLGGLLSDIFRVSQLMAKEASPKADLLPDLLEASRIGLHAYARTGLLEAPAAYRLPFREFGLSIGLHAIERLNRLFDEKPEIFDKKRSLRGQVESLKRHIPMAETIEAFWLKPANREASTFTDHYDINTVMLATSLASHGYLICP
jgi:hypothetical protein